MPPTAVEPPPGGPTVGLPGVIFVELLLLVSITVTAMMAPTMTMPPAMVMGLGKGQ